MMSQLLENVFHEQDVFILSFIQNLQYYCFEHVFNLLTLPSK